MKPKMREVHPTHAPSYWICAGSGAWGTGYTMDEAYWSWAKDLRVQMLHR